MRNQLTHASTTDSRFSKGRKTNGLSFEYITCTCILEFYYFTNYIREVTLVFPPDACD